MEPQFHIRPRTGLRCKSFGLPLSKSAYTVTHPPSCTLHTFLLPRLKSKFVTIDHDMHCVVIMRNDGIFDNYSTLNYTTSSWLQVWWIVYELQLMYLLKLHISLISPILSWGVVVKISPLLLSLLRSSVLQGFILEIAQSL